jgi:uncharacterized protein YggE
MRLSNYSYNSYAKPNNSIAFGMTDEGFIKHVLDKTVKGSRKIPDVVDNISFEVDQPSPVKKQALLEAIKKADDWYKEVLELLAKDWGLKID